MGHLWNQMGWSSYHWATMHYLKSTSQTSCYFTLQQLRWAEVRGAGLVKHINTLSVVGAALCTSVSCWWLLSSSGGADWCRGLCSRAQWWYFCRLEEQPKFNLLSSFSQGWEKVCWKDGKQDKGDGAIIISKALGFAQHTSTLISWFKQRQPGQFMDKEY